MRVHGYLAGMTWHNCLRWSDVGVASSSPSPHGEEHVVAFSLLLDDCIGTHPLRAQQQAAMDT